MNEIEVTTLQKAIENIESMIENKDVLIRQQEDEIKSLKKAIKECYNESLSEGMDKAWNLAQRIVHREWVGDENIHTVEDWFELFTAKDALVVMEKQKPHWKKDIVRNVFECSQCGFPSLIQYKHCPGCGVKME